MIRKITKNQHQYKVSLPIEMLRKMAWDHNTVIKFQEVETPLGKGLLIIKNEDEPIRLEVK